MHALDCYWVPRIKWHIECRTSAFSLIRSLFPRHPWPSRDASWVVSKYSFGLEKLVIDDVLVESLPVNCYLIRNSWIASCVALFIDDYGVQQRNFSNDASNELDVKSVQWWSDPPESAQQWWRLLTFLVNLWVNFSAKRGSMTANLEVVVDPAMMRLGR